MITVVNWNIAKRLQAVEELLAMDADVALLQEVSPGTLEFLKEAGGSVAVGPQDPWEPWPREHYDLWNGLVLGGLATRDRWRATYPRQLPK